MKSLVNSSVETYRTERALPSVGGVVADRVQQVRLAQPGAAVDEQRVVRLGRRLGDRDRRGVREPVGRADDERLEHVLRVEPVAAVVRPGGRRRRVRSARPVPLSVAASRAGRAARARSRGVPTGPVGARTRSVSGRAAGVRTRVVRLERRAPSVRSATGAEACPAADRGRAGRCPCPSGTAAAGAVSCGGSSCGSAGTAAARRSRLPPGSSSAAGRCALDRSLRQTVPVAPAASSAAGR